nr:ALK tyrosine kinase receptor scd-2 like [Ipomoea batatas]
MQSHQGDNRRVSGRPNQRTSSPIQHPEFCRTQGGQFLMEPLGPPKGGSRDSVPNGALYEKEGSSTFVAPEFWGSLGCGLWFDDDVWFLVQKYEAKSTKRAAFDLEPEPAMASPWPIYSLLLLSTRFLLAQSSSNTNHIYSPCADSKLSPCDRRLSLPSSSQLAVFRPKVDEISLLTINTSNFFPDTVGGYMVAFAGRKYAARSVPAFVANGTYIVTSFTLVLEFKKGRLQNLHWKRDGCASCKHNTNFACLNGQDCAMKVSSCKNRGSGNADCSLGIQLTFSGTDKHDSVFNSWYEVKNLRQYSLYSVYSNLRESLSSQYNKFF